jgi:uncharacterized protein with HEPN domain
MARLWDMLEAAKTVLEFIEGIDFDAFMADRKTRFAVERNLEIIGEAARRVTQATRDLTSDIPWKSIVSLRNIIAHEYGEILYENLWRVCVHRLPPLIARLEAMNLTLPFDDEED